MHIQASTLFNTFSPTGILTCMVGEDVLVTGIAALEACGPGDLVFVEQKESLEHVRERRPSVAVIHPAIQDLLLDFPDLTLLVTKNVKLAFALIRQRYGDRDVLHSEWPAIHPSAVIHESCEIGEGSRIGPQVVLGKNVRIGKETAIMAGAVVEHGTVIGDRSVIHPNATICYDTIIGDEAVIQSGAVVGSEGYGFAHDEKGRGYRIPQLGRVLIEDRVSVGSGCCIDRPAFTETRIGAGTKLDNLCHIAHNVDIGEDCMLTAAFVVAGSAKIGNRVNASGQTGVLGHLEICDDVTLLHRAGVNSSIDEPGMYAGLPLQPLRTYQRNLVVQRNLSDLRKQVRALEKKLSEM